MTVTNYWYQITPDDVLWMLRAVQAEGQPRHLVASCLLNRYVFLRARRLADYPTLALFIRAYCSPVNPRRMRGGRIWERLWRASNAAKRAQLARLDRKRRKHSTRTAFDADTTDAVLRACTNSPELTSATDFAAYDHVPPSHLVPLQPGTPNSNALYAVDPAWQGYTVRWTKTVVSSEFRICRVEIPEVCAVELAPG